MNLKDYIKIVNNWPIEGVEFKDITPLMADGEAFKYAVDQIIEFANKQDAEISEGAEARVFIVGCQVAYALDIGLPNSRKPNKMPREVIQVDYGLKYGKNTLTIHKDAVKTGQKVLTTDDLLATGGTIEATIDLVEKLGGVVVGCAFLVELGYLKGIDKLEGYDVLSLMKYE